MVLYVLTTITSLQEYKYRHCEEALQTFIAIWHCDIHACDRWMHLIEQGTEQSECWCTRVLVC